MALRDRLYELTTLEEFDEFLVKFPTCIVFKAGTCHKTMEGFAQVEQVFDGYEQIHLGFIRVVESRAASNHVAALTGIVHESPQVIFFVEGRAVFDLDNWDVTTKALAPAALAAYGEPGEAAAGPVGDLSDYVELLDAFVAGRLRGEDFKEQWRALFRQDASLRSYQECALIRGLFEDIDQPLGLEGDEALQDRAFELLQQLLSITEPAVSP